MGELAVIIDMDKTVVPTWEFMSDVTQALETGFGVDQREFYEQIDGRHITEHENLRHYDFFEHVRGLGLDGDEVEKYILQALSGRDYVYDDVPQFLSFLLSEIRPDLAMILTYGEHRFQQLKYKCAPTLARLACVDILQPKGTYIEEHFAGYHGVIIDDKPIANLPESFKGVLLEREAEPSSVHQHSSLSQVKERWPDIAYTPPNVLPPP